MYEVFSTHNFEKDIKKHKKRFRNVFGDIEEIIKEIEQGNLVGDEITDLKLPDVAKVFKVRQKNTDTKEGKSNGYRIIYYAITDMNEAYLLTLYYKGDKEDIKNNDIIDIINSNI